MHDFKHRSEAHRLASDDWICHRDKMARFDSRRSDEYDAFMVRAMAYHQHRGFMADTEVLRRYIGGIHALAMPKYTVLRPPNGAPSLALIDNGLTEDMRQSIAVIEAQIRAVAVDWGITLAVPIDALA